MAEFLAWKADPSKQFGKEIQGFEKLRKPWPKDAPFNLVETSYYGFSIPEVDIHCEIYHWAHPMFNVTSGGVMIFRGRKKRQYNAEYINYLNYQPLPEDITDCTYEDGVSIKVIKPGEEIEISYDDPAAKTSFHFTSKAIMPPAFRPTGGHITQALKTTGTLTLRGETHKIDSYFTRDRSWGDPRAEQRMDVAPIGWHVGVFGDDLAFHVTAFDSPELNPELAERYPGMENGNNYIWGYIWKEGKLIGVKSCRKSTQRDKYGIAPESIEIEITDEYDVVYVIKGNITASLPMSVWPNMCFHFCLTRWTMEGEERVAWGDTQECLYEDYIREHYIDSD